MSSGFGPVIGPLFTIPEGMARRFAMNGKANISLNWYCDDDGTQTLTWRRQDFDASVDLVRDAVARGRYVQYKVDRHLPQVFAQFPIDGHRVVLFGSQTPMYEAYVHVFGGQPHTVEYRRIVHDIPVVSAETPEEFAAHAWPLTRVLSISSIEHSGLGRYGDAIDPDADLATMQGIRARMAADGEMILSVPLGRDQVVWNAHRIYGRHRLPMLLEGWEVIARFGYAEDLLENSDQHGQEAIFVLRPA